MEQWTEHLLLHVSLQPVELPPKPSSTFPFLPVHVRVSCLFFPPEIMFCCLHSVQRVKLHSYLTVNAAGGSKMLSQWESEIQRARAREECMLGRERWRLERVLLLPSCSIYQYHAHYKSLAEVELMSHFYIYTSLRERRARAHMFQQVLPMLIRALNCFLQMNTNHTHTHRHTQAQGSNKQQQKMSSGFRYINNPESPEPRLSLKGSEVTWAEERRGEEKREEDILTVNWKHNIPIAMRAVGD